jgi:hypothetical protein
VVWFRLSLLNLLIVALAIVLTVLKNVTCGIEISHINFPFQLYLTAAVLTNLIYILGNLFELIYLLIWNKESKLHDFEPEFFKAGIAKPINNGEGTHLIHSEKMNGVLSSSLFIKKTSGT